MAFGLFADVRRALSTIKINGEESMNRSRKEIPLSLALAALLFTSIPALSAAQAAPAAAITPGPVLVAKIAANLSSKNAKVGDSVAAKTLKGYKLPDGTDIPKGSKITGKLESVQSKKAGNGDSMMTFQLEQIEVKGGATVPIHGLIVAIGPSLSPNAGVGGSSLPSRNASTPSGASAPPASRGAGSSSGMDPNLGTGSAAAKDENDIPLGSTLDGVALGKHTGADWTTALKGLRSEINLDSDVLIKVQLK